MNLPPCEHPFESNRVDGTADFRPDWDVPSAGGSITAALTRDIAAVRDGTAPSAARRIHLIRGAPGYGKTHLFGRVQAEQGERVRFVFVPAPPDPARPAAYVCWRLVETLFHPAGAALAPLRHLLARFLRPSFAAYFDELPDGLRAKSTAVRQALAGNPLAVFEVLAPVTDLGPFHAVADSIRQRFPDLSGATVRALILGLSPAGDDARTWLRGEPDQLPEERLAELRLDDRSPEPADVIRAVATLLGRISVPLVLCLDQLDQLYLGSAAGFQNLAGQLMGWLQSVPNLVVVLGCVDEQWRRISEEASLSAFVHRVKVHDLGPLSPAEARELVSRRVGSWDEFDPSRGDGWPFDLAAVEKFVQRQPASPRGFIDRCATAFDDWRAGGSKGLIALEAGPPPAAQLPELFVREWDRQLAATRQALKAATDYQDAELWAGVAEALQVARHGQPAPAGASFERWTPQALKKTPSDSRPSAELQLAVGNRRVGVVVAVSKKDGGTAFGHWLAALEGTLGGAVAGAVVVWPKGQLTVGKTAESFKRYQALVHAGTVRPFPLDANADAFAQLECLRRLIGEAAAGMVVLDGKTLSADECRGLVARTGLLANLKLFEFLFHGWPAVTEALSRVPAAAVPPPAPAQPTAQPPAVRPALAGAAAPPVTAAPRQPAAGAVAAPSPVRPAPAGPVPGPTWAEEMLARVVDKLRLRGQPVRSAGVEVGPTFVRLKVEPKDDTDFAKVKRQADNLKMHLGVEQRPLIAAQAGFISIDVQRPDRQPVPLAPLLATRPPDLAGQPAFPVGVDVAGRPHWLNLAEPATCHLLVAGTTGSGKSQLLKALIASLAAGAGPDRVQFLLIDPKQVTFGLSGDSPYLRRPVVFDAGEAIDVVEECCEEMDRRYTLLRARGKEHVGELAGADALPRWVLVFDEFADLMVEKASKKALEACLKRLGAKARAAGLHLVLGTQRPEASVVTPLLRSNLPGRIGLQVPTERDSNIILDEPDAAHLLDKGDLLWRRGGGLVRLQSPFVSKEQLEAGLRLH